MSVPGTVESGGVGPHSCLKKRLALTDVSLNELRELVMARDAWRAAIHGVSKSRTRLSD